MKLYFSGMTGPEASGGFMAVGHAVYRGREIVTMGGHMYPPNSQLDHASWHTATYLALLELCFWCQANGIGGEHGGRDFVMLCDNRMAVDQLRGSLEARKGHYLDAHEEALDAFCRTFPLRNQVKFQWVAAHTHPAFLLCRNLFDVAQVRPWSWTDRKEPCD